MYKPKHLKRWIEQINYTGANFDEYYVAVWRFFRCTPLERSNFKYVREHLRDCGDTSGYVEAAFTDEVMMCRYYLLVHETADRALKMADMFAGRVKQKGSLDPDGERELDLAAVTKIWHMKSIAGRVELCQEAGVSIFAARRKDPTHELLIESLSEVS